MLWVLEGWKGGYHLIDLVACRFVVEVGVVSIIKRVDTAACPGVKE